MKINKKLLSIVGLSALALGIGLSVVMPNQSATSASAATHYHDNYATWNCTRNGHYHPCTDDCNVLPSQVYLHDNDGFAYSKHVDSDSDGKCDVCGYYITKPASAQYLVNPNTKLETEIWYMMDSTTLTIGGYGNTNDYSISSLPPLAANDYTKLPWFTSDGTALKTNFKTIVIAEGVTRIGNNMFNNSAGLYNSVKNIVFSDSIISVGSNSFDSMMLDQLDLGNNIRTIESNAFSSLELDSDLYFPSTIKNILTKAFDSANFSFNDVIFSEGITSLGNSAFSNAMNADNLVFPSTLTSIDTNTFKPKYMSSGYPFMTARNAIFKSQQVPTGSNMGLYAAKFYVPVGKEADYCTYIENNTESMSFLLYGHYYIYCPNYKGGTLSTNKDFDMVKGTEFNTTTKQATSVFESGQSITVTATPATESKYNCYEITYSYGSTEKEITSSRNFTMPKSHVNLKAIFKVHKHKMSENFHYTDKVHYRICEEDYCDVRSQDIQYHTDDEFAYGSHYDNDGDRMCDVCGFYVRPSGAAKKPVNLRDLENDIELDVWYLLDKDSSNPDEYVLTIGGSGNMPDYSVSGSNPNNYHLRPWEKDNEYFSKIKTLRILTGVTSIGSYAFADMSITKVIGMKSVTVIAPYAFKGASLTEISIPNNVISVWEYAFSECSNLEKAKLSKNMQNVSYGLFYECNKLTKVDIPYGIERVHDYAFSGCRNLKELVFPETAKSFSVGFIQNCNIQYLVFKCKEFSSLTICGAMVNNIVIPELGSDNKNHDLITYIGKKCVDPYGYYYTAFMFNIKSDSHIVSSLSSQYILYQPYDKNGNRSGNPYSVSDTLVTVTTNGLDGFVVDSVMDNEENITSTKEIVCKNKHHDVSVTETFSKHTHSFGAPVYELSGDEYIATVTCSCGYTYSEKSATVMARDSFATCTENETVHKTHVFDAAIFTTKVEESYEIPDTALGHNMTVHESELAPTCLVPGHKEYYYCANCSIYFEDADGETPIGNEDALELWLAENGNGYISPLGHHFSGDITYTWDGDECTASWHCDHTGCEEVQTETVTSDYIIDEERTCLTNEFGHYDAKFTNTSFEEQVTDSFEVQDTALGHKFDGEVTYTWDGDECTAIWYCQREGCEESQYETVEGLYIVDTPATCLTNEKGHYWAMFSVPGFATQTTPKNSVEIPNSALGHEYGGNISYSWDGDVCTATWGCVHTSCTSTEIESKQGIVVVDTPATCEENALGHFEVTFDNKAFGTVSTPANSYEIPNSATGHEFGDFTYEWDDYICTATSHCIHDGCDEIHVETAVGQYVMDTPATCTKNEKGHYRAEFTLYPELGVRETEANSVEIPNTKLGHHFSGEVTYTWDGDMCTASWSCDHPGCNQVEKETVKAEYVVDIPAGCATNEFGHYVAKFANQNFADCATEMFEKPNSAHGHINHVVYSWNADHTKCEATIMCEEGDYTYKESGVITYADGYAIATFTNAELETQRDPFTYVDPGMPTWEIATIAGGSTAGVIVIAVIIIIIVKKKK